MKKLILALVLACVPTLVSGTMVSFPFMTWPTLTPAGWSGAPSLGTQAFAINTTYGIVYRATKTCAIQKVRFRTGATTAGGTLTFTIESVATTGLAGGIWATDTSITHVLGSGDDNVNLVTANLTASANVVTGDLFAITVLSDGVANGQYATSADDVNTGGGAPYTLVNGGTTSGTPIMMYPECDDGSFMFLTGISATGAITTTAASNSAGVRRGNIFTPTVDARTCGAAAWVDADGDFSIRLYDSVGTTLLATTGVIDDDARVNTTASPYYLPWSDAAGPATYDVDAGTAYRIAVTPEHASDTVGMYDYLVPDIDMLAITGGGGSSMFLTTYNGTVWSDAATTSRAYVSMILCGFDDGTGTGGGANGRIIGGF